MDVLVTGARGRIGPRLVAGLRARGHTVREASRSSPTRVDLATGEGVAEAVREVDVILHAASSAFGDPRGVDVDGTRRLREAAPDAHLVYASIVGCDRVPVAYYQAKTEAERLLTQHGGPHTILRITQFHVFLDEMMSGWWFPIWPALQGPGLQPIDEQEAADALVVACEGAPAGRAPDLGGPETIPFREIFRTWLSARKRSRWVLPMPAIGSAGRALAEGALCAPSGRKGTRTWEEWLAKGPV
jgi:uncharacterized protein YbjT (DUF2867 family)